MKAIQFSKIKRELIAKAIFGSRIQLICNPLHQYLQDYNTMYLGSNCTDPHSPLNDSDIFPIALRADISCYLFRGKKNLNQVIIKNLNFEKRAEKLELMAQIKEANILPHGGGYNFPDIIRVVRVIEYKDQRYFVCSLKSKMERVKIIRDVTNLQFKYRGRSVVLKSIQLELGNLVARLNPLFSLKV
ncbi:MAG: hypothetical protein ACTSXH_02490 [Promethearchaeota archaeon]